MKTSAHRELRNHSSEVLRRVQQGESFQVTNHGVVVAVLSPVPAGLTSAPRVVAPTHSGGFSDIPRRRSPELTQEALDALRAE